MNIDNNIFQLIVIALLIIVVVIQAVLLFRKIQINLEPIHQALHSVENSYERIERFVRDEFIKKQRRN